MALRHVFRSKFLTDKSEEPNNGKSHTSVGYNVSNGEIDQRTDTAKDGRKNTTEQPSSAEMNAGCSHDDWDTFDDKEVFELQLSNLQEQLIDVMVTNQSLLKELNQLKDENHVESIYKNLEKEKAKNIKLKARMTQLEEENRKSRVQAPENDVLILEDKEEAGDIGNGSSVSESSRSWRLRMWFHNKMMTILQDLSDDNDLDDDTDAVEEDLSVRMLKENMKRFKTGSEPILLYFKAISALLSWRSPSSTFLTFLVYMYALYTGWLFTVCLGLLLWHFSKTYLISRGWNIEFSLLPYHAVDQGSDEEKTLGVSDKFQLILHVAKKAQNLLGEVADGLEKLHSLMMWSDVEVTRLLYTNIMVAFILSIFVSTSTLLTCGGFFIGFKFFITANIYRRYPRLKQKYDTTQIMWKKLPTNERRIQEQIIAQRRQYLVNVPRNRLETAPSTPNYLDSLTAGDGCKMFKDIFKLQDDECPLKGWEDGKRTTLIQKEKAIPAAFRTGKLYLTKSYLCFWRSRTVSVKNLTIPLCDITKFEKIKPFSFLPGSGMSIEIHVSSAEKPYVFGAILNRDEIFDHILQMAQAAQHSWVTTEREPVTNEDAAISVTD